MTDKITLADRAAICRDAWCRAYVVAIEAVEPVRAHIGAAMRAAWAMFRQDRSTGRTRVTMTVDYEERHGREDRRQARQHLKQLLTSKAALPPPAPVLSPREIMRIVLQDRIARSDCAVVQIREQIDRDVASHGLSKINDRQHDRINELYHEGRTLRDDLYVLDRGSIVLPPARQYADPLADGRLRVLRAQDIGLTSKLEQLAPLAQRWCEGSAAPECLDAAVELEKLWDNREALRAKICAAESAAAAEAARPVQLDLVGWLAAQPAMTFQPMQRQQAQAETIVDLTTAEGLAKVLVGRTARLHSPSGGLDYKIVAVNRWKAPNGTWTRDYILFETTDRLKECREGPRGVFIERVGSSRGQRVETQAGIARWSYGALCGSGLTQRLVDDLVRALLEPLIEPWIPSLSQTLADCCTATSGSGPSQRL